MEGPDDRMLVYDGAGNLTSYDGKTFVWKNGRQLREASVSGGTVAAYTYDHEGKRASKTVGGVKHTYIYSGDLLMCEKATVLEMKFSYDSVGNPVAVMYNGTEYYYVMNLQGDIIGLVNAAGAWVVEYRYDVWGNIQSISGSLAGTLGADNPLRYRGYYYDTETGLYYISCRYYNPEIGRFISPDTTNVLEVQDDLYDKNLYAYCDNNPVMRVDSSGAVWHLAVGAAVGVATQFVADVGIGLATGNSFGEVIASLSPVDYVSAAIGGSIAASGIGFAGAVVANAALGGTTYLANCSYKGVEANTNDFIASTAIGGVAGLIGGSGANGKNMRGVYSRSKQVINATKSTRKQAMYKAKITTIKKDVAKSSVKIVTAGLFSNMGNFARRLFSGSMA